MEVQVSLLQLIFGSGLGYLVALKLRDTILHTLDWALPKEEMAERAYKILDKTVPKRVIADWITFFTILLVVWIVLSVVKAI